MKDLAGNEYVPSKAYNSTGCYAGGNAEVCFAWDGVRVTPTEFAEKARLVSIERDQLRAEVERLRRQRTEFDCRYTLGDVADISGSHCPLDSKCQRCKREDAELQIRDLVGALQHMRICQPCADDDWGKCEGGRAALDAMNKAFPKGVTK